MKNVLFSTINWGCIEYVGFDMDGTLYDEYEFIKQPYLEISRLFKTKDPLYYMSNRWIEKGSSYNKIFDETYDLYSNFLIVYISKDEFINKSLDIFRNFTPKISLSSRVKYLLDFFKRNYTIFLITDGNTTLQQKKFSALGLDSIFEAKNVFFTGVDAKKYSKPRVDSIGLLDIVPERTVYFGDRDIDEQFSINANIQFEAVCNMIKVQK